MTDDTDIPAESAPEGDASEVPRPLPPEAEAIAESFGMDTADVAEEGGAPGFRVKLSVFEGPLDLLLHLIKKHEMEIYDIDMAKITEQYLEYLNIMKSLNINVAGEFLVMAATLLHIKSQMLLPVEEKEEEGEEDGPDPREELIRRLLEYQRYKDVADELRERSLLGRDVFTRQPNEIELDFDPGLEEVSLFQLVAAFDKVLKAAKIESVHEVEIERVTVRERIVAVLEMLEQVTSMPFEELFSDVGTRDGMIATFLAILELIRLRVIRIRQTELFGPIFVSRAVTEEVSAQEVVESTDIEEYQ